MFDKSYYKNNGLDRDRPALMFYTRLARRLFKPGRVLDFGCGTGHLIKKLNKYFVCDGFEISEYGREKSKNNVPSAHIWSEIDEFESCLYTGITALHVLEHINDDQVPSVLAAWRTALVPHGRVLCVMPEREGLGHALKKNDWIAFKDTSHINLKRRNDWHEVFIRNGFKVLSVGTDGLWDFPYSQRFPKFIDFLVNAPATAVQFIAGKLILPPGRGESSIFFLEKVEPESSSTT